MDGSCIKINIWIKSFLAILGSSLFSLMLASIAVAENPEQVTVEVEFVTPIKIVNKKKLRYGWLDVNLADGETVIIAPDGSVTDTFNRVAGGNQHAAEVGVTAIAAKSITILVDNLSGATGYTLGSWMCNYDGAGSDSACGGAGYSETSIADGTLLIGATLTGNGAAVIGVDNSSFDVTITYQ